MNIGGLVGVGLGIKLVNGKIKPKQGIGAKLGITIMVILLLVAIVGLIYTIFNFNSELFVCCLLGIFCLVYLLLISPYTQKSDNYYIEFQNENSVVGFKLYYKGKLVNIQYKVDKEGKIAFANNQKKLNCISYADGSKMSNLEKYRVLNYFGKWLQDNKLFSSEITVTFEEI